MPINGEWIGDQPDGKTTEKRRDVELHCSDAATAEIPPRSLDAVFTDPPYFGNVQYAELMDFCYVWLRLLVNDDIEAFRSSSTRNSHELTGNEDMGRGIVHFTEGLSSVFRRMATALKTGAPLAFTYHHNDLAAYHPIAVAILDSSLTCSAAMPCPAEMGASIHINGTGSSIIDTVFVCRSTGTVPRKVDRRFSRGSRGPCQRRHNQPSSRKRETDPRRYEMHRSWSSDPFGSLESSRGMGQERKYS